jgi:hypothetical protein
MAYTSKWERLDQTLTGVMTATGVSEDKAKADICRAIADRAVNVQGKLWKHAMKPTTSSEVLEGEGFAIPDEIKPEELDWESSRPLKPWRVRSGTRVLGFWELRRIELSSPDVREHLCRPGRQSEPARQASFEPDAATRWQPALASGDSAVGVDLRSITRLPPAAGGSARRRGPRPTKLDGTIDRMRSNIREGRCTVAQLEAMPEKVLAAEYDVSRDTARKARNAVLSEFGE